ncbi:hypothetical protein DFH09DRAFT_1099470 [Mycena vulgaris]|nr:hypothetical protein DFH09DRAFT_1099470 [Mycena vulgaris]
MRILGRRLIARDWRSATRCDARIGLLNVHGRGVARISTLPVDLRDSGVVMGMSEAEMTPAARSIKRPDEVLAAAEGCGGRGAALVGGDWAGSWRMVAVVALDGGTGDCQRPRSDRRISESAVECEKHEALSRWVGNGVGGRGGRGELQIATAGLGVEEIDGAPADARKSSDIISLGVAGIPGENYDPRVRAAALLVMKRMKFLPGIPQGFPGENMLLSHSRSVRIPGRNVFGATVMRMHRGDEDQVSCPRESSAFPEEK